MLTFHISEIAADGDNFPVPGEIIDTMQASNAIEALNIYSDRQGFAPYSLLQATEVDAIIPNVWNTDMTIASAPFTNTEIMAYTDDAIA